MEDRPYLETVLEQAVKGLADDEKNAVEAIRNQKDTLALPDQLLNEEHGGTSDVNLQALISEMTIPQKIKLALFGNKTARNFLVRDSNRQIPLFVLGNGRITEDEILEFCANVNLDSSVFREISGNRSWVKSYQIRLALMSNPKVPIGVTLGWVSYLQERDLNRLAKSKNIPQALAQQCKKVIDKRRPK